MWHLLPTPPRFKDGANFEVAFYPETKAAFPQFDGKPMRLPKRFSLTSQRFSKDGPCSA